MSKWFFIKRFNDSSSRDLNEDFEIDFLLKDLNEEDLDTFCHAIIRWQIRTSYELAETLFGKDASHKEQKKLKTEILKEKVSELEKML